MGSAIGAMDSSSIHCSIAVNIFLLGSIGKASFIKFVVWTGIILLYYIFFGLHASYDTAKASAMERMEKVDVLG